MNSISSVGGPHGSQRRPTFIESVPTRSKSPIRRSASSEVTTLQQKYKSVAIKDLRILERFLEYATEEVDYADAGSPSAAMTFATLGHFFDDAELISVLDSAQQCQLIEEIRPPPGRLVTWADFLTILQIVADAVHPTIPNESLALELVCRRALEKLRALDQAGRVGTAHAAAAVVQPLPQKSSAERATSSSSPAGDSEGTPPDASGSRRVVDIPVHGDDLHRGSVSPVREVAATEASIQGERPATNTTKHHRAHEGVSSTSTKVVGVKHSTTPGRSHGSKVTASSSTSPYRPHGLSELAASLSAFLDVLRARALRALPPSVEPSLREVHHHLMQSLIDKIAPLSPRPCRVRALQITFQNDTQTANQLVDALTDLISSVPLLDHANRTGQRSLVLHEETLWNSVRLCGAILFPTSPPIAQEELGFQVFHRAMEQ